MHYSQSHFFFGLDNVMDDKLRREWSIYIEPAEHYLLEYFALVPTTKSKAIIFSDYWFIANLKPLLYLDDYPAYHFCFWLVIFLNNNVAFFFMYYYRKDVNMLDIADTLLFVEDYILFSKNFLSPHWQHLYFFFFDQQKRELGYTVPQWYA